MDRREIALKLTLNALGLSVKMDTFDDRLVFQKAVYLAQAAGIDMGYYYGWYLRGPYSSAAAADGFAVANELAVAAGADESEGWQLDAESLAKLAKIRPLFGADETSMTGRLELLASVHYLLARKQVVGEDAETIKQKLWACGKEQFSQEDVETALGTLREYELLS